MLFVAIGITLAVFALVYLSLAARLNKRTYPPLPGRRGGDDG